jgi:hypothetical protein
MNFNPTPEPDFTVPILPPEFDTDAEVDLEILRAVPRQFSICDEKSANWLVRKIETARQYAVSVKLWADLEVRRAEREENTLMFLFGRQIEGWAREEITKLNGKRKSLSLPGGKLGFRKEATKLVIDDDAQVLLWAYTHCPVAIQTVQKLSRTIVKEHFEKTGEMPESGVHIQLEQEKFYIG